jgi:hypothetical protein
MTSIKKQITSLKVFYSSENIGTEDNPFWLVSEKKGKQEKFGLLVSVEEGGKTIYKILIPIEYKSISPLEDPEEYDWITGGVPNFKVETFETKGFHIFNRREMDFVSRKKVFSEITRNEKGVFIFDKKHLFSCYYSLYCGPYHYGTLELPFDICKTDVFLVVNSSDRHQEGDFLIVRIHPDTKVFLGMSKVDLERGKIQVIHNGIFG